MTVKLSISLTDQQAEYARKQVEEGRASSTSAVIQQALEAKRREDEDYESWKAGFFELLAEREKGPHVDAETFDGMVEDMLKDERTRLGLVD
jgi:antitoxin ParD1/3/4